MTDNYVKKCFYCGKPGHQIKECYKRQGMKEEANKRNIRGVLLVKRRTTAMIFDYSQSIVLFQHQREMRTTYGMSTLAHHHT